MAALAATEVENLALLAAAAAAAVEAKSRRAGKSDMINFGLRSFY